MVFKVFFMSRKFIPLALLFVLILSFAHAQSALDTFSVDVTALNNRIAVNETATFNITVYNGYAEEREFQIEKVGYPYWDMHTTPITNPITIVVPSKGQESLVLHVRPLHITVEDTYNVDTYVTDLSSGRKQNIPLTIGLQSTDALIQGYVPTVLTTVSVPKNADPREPLHILINLNNQNALDYPNLTIILSSNLINGEFNYRLGHREEKRVEIVTSIDPLTPPQQDRLTVFAYREDRTVINPITSDFSVKEYVIKEEHPATSSLLRTEKTITFFSNNPSYEGTIKEETSSFKSLFTSTRPKSSLTQEGDKKYLVWNIALDANRTMDITIVQNYRPLVIIVVVILTLLGLYFVFRSPIVLVKEVAAVSLKEGGISDVKIILRVKNRGKEPLTQIEVGDVVPPIASVEKEVALGVMQPEKILPHQRQGTIIKWLIPELAPNEGVVLSYKMKSRLTILGDFHLPSATARCKHRNSYVITNSNRVTVNG